MMVSDVSRLTDAEIDAIESEPLSVTLLELGRGLLQDARDAYDRMIYLADVKPVPGTGKDRAKRVVRRIAAPLAGIATGLGVAASLYPHMRDVPYRAPANPTPEYIQDHNGDAVFLLIPLVPVALAGLAAWKTTDTLGRAAVEGACRTYQNIVFSRKGRAPERPHSVYSLNCDCIEAAEGTDAFHDTGEVLPRKQVMAMSAELMLERNIRYERGTAPVLNPGGILDSGYFVEVNGRAAARNMVLHHGDEIELSGARFQDDLPVMDDRYAKFTVREHPLKEPTAGMSPNSLFAYQS